jgi:hypothetical protein
VSEKIRKMIPKDLRGTLDALAKAGAGKSDPLRSREFSEMLRGAPVEPVRDFIRANLVDIAMAWQAEKIAEIEATSKRPPTSGVDPNRRIF